MKDIETTKKNLYAFGKKHGACEEGLEDIKGNNLTELFELEFPSFLEFKLTIEE